VWESIRAQMDVDPDALGAPGDVPPPTVLAERRRRRSRGIVAVAVAAVIAAGAVATVATLDGGGPGGSSVEAAAQAAIRDPDARRVALRRPDGQVAARLAVYGDGRGYFVDATLAPLDDRQTYQLWAITDGGPVSEAVLGAAPNAAKLRGTANERAAKYAITTEPRGGSRSPTGAFVASSGVEAA